MRTTSRSKVSALAVALALGGMASGCSVEDARPPECPVGDDDDISTLALMAQSVPRAQLVPCIRLYVTGWSLAAIDVEDGRSRFWLDSDRAGDRALEVVLRESCDVARATEVATDERGARRFEQIEQIEGDFRARRFYVSPGSCATYFFRFDQEQASALVNEASLMLGFVSRRDLRAQIREDSDGLVDDGP